MSITDPAGGLKKRGFELSPRIQVAGSGRSRTEAFLEWAAHEHAGEVYAIQEADAERALVEFERGASRGARAEEGARYRSAPARSSSSCWLRSRSEA
jgi:hypothetical protein